jgi:hypothetical protein
MWAKDRYRWPEQMPPNSIAVALVSGGFAMAANGPRDTDENATFTTSTTRGVTTNILSVNQHLVLYCHLCSTSTVPTQTSVRQMHADMLSIKTTMHARTPPPIPTRNQRAFAHVNPIGPSSQPSRCPLLHTSKPYREAGHSS